MTRQYTQEGCAGGGWQDCPTIESVVEARMTGNERTEEVPDAG